MILNKFKSRQRNGVIVKAFDEFHVFLRLALIDRVVGMMEKILLSLKLISGESGKIWINKKS